MLIAINCMHKHLYIFCWLLIVEIEFKLSLNDQRYIDEVAMANLS